MLERPQSCDARKKRNNFSTAQIMAGPAVTSISNLPFQTYGHVSIDILPILVMLDMSPIALDFLAPHVRSTQAATRSILRGFDKSTFAQVVATVELDSGFGPGLSFEFSLVEIESILLMVPALSSWNSLSGVSAPASGCITGARGCSVRT